MKPPRPTRQQLRASKNKTVPDVVAPRLKVLFVGINPGLYSAAVKHHFARPGNRFWPALHRAGFIDRLLSPHEERELLKRGCGITNIVNRATASAADLSQKELKTGGRRLAAKVRRLRPRVVAVLGVGAYRAAFGRKRIAVGPQPEPHRHNAGVGAAEPEWPQRELPVGRARAPVPSLATRDRITSADVGNKKPAGVGGFFVEA